MMAGGIFIGYLLRNKNLTFTPHAISMMIWILLFLLGVSLGSNEKLMRSLGTLGVEAVILAAVSMVGSMTAAYLLYKTCKKHTK